MTEMLTDAMQPPVTVDLVWIQTLNGATEVIKADIPLDQAYDALAEEARAAAMGAYGPGSGFFLRPSADPLAQVTAELARARGQHAPLNSAHEAYAVLLEELDEFKAETWKKTALRDRAAMRAELIQLAAMAIRTIEDLAL